MFVLVITIFSLLLALARNVTTIIHELGHALAGLLLYKGKMSIYVGSYGDPERGIHFKMGRFNVHFKYNLLLWNHGLCRAETDSDSLPRSFIFALAGPLMSLLIAIPCFFVLTGEMQNDYFKTACFIFGLSSIIDFFQNIYPDREPVMLHNGSVIYNDGQTLKNIILLNRINKILSKLYELYKTKEYKKGAKYFDRVNNDYPDILRMGIVFYIHEYNYETAFLVSDKLKNVAEFNSIDYSNLALLYTHTKEYEKANENYQIAIELDPENFNSYNNRGYNLILQGNYEKAIPDLNKCIEINPEYAFAFNNRGLAKIKSGEPEQGLADIRRSLVLDNANAYAYRNLGIYYYEKKEFVQAYDQFKKVMEIDPNVPENDEYLEKTRIELNRSISS